MKFDDEAPPVTYADAETRKRFSWTDAETNEPIKSPQDNYYRWATVMPMTSDGTFIYTLVQWYESETVDHT